MFVPFFFFVFPDVSFLDPLMLCVTRRCHGVQSEACFGNLIVPDCVSKGKSYLSVWLNRLSVVDLRLKILTRTRILRLSSDSLCIYDLLWNHCKATFGTLIVFIFEAAWPCGNNFKWYISSSLENNGKYAVCYLATHSERGSCNSARLQLTDF